MNERSSYVCTIFVVEIRYIYNQALMYRGHKIVSAINIQNFTSIHNMTKTARTRFRN